MKMVLVIPLNGDHACVPYPWMPFLETKINMIVGVFPNADNDDDNDVNDDDNDDNDDGDDDDNVDEDGDVEHTGVRLHYVEAGKEDAPLLLFVHGFPEFWFVAFFPFHDAHYNHDCFLKW